jgi:hypothetical protein
LSNIRGAAHYVGAELARDGITAVLPMIRVACIASKLGSYDKSKPRHSTKLTPTVRGAP